MPLRDGIEHRLAAVLRYLATRYPREGWHGFFAHGVPKWRLIVMAGHSQGGSEAAFIGMTKREPGALLTGAEVRG